jgi:manganese transport protein
VVVALLFVLALAFVYLVARSPFSGGAAASGLVPGFADANSVLLACGIVGATVMPHAVFLHSSLVGGLSSSRVRSIRTSTMLRFVRRDVIVAMGVAGLVNVLMLLVATSLPAGTGGSLTAVHSAFAADRGVLFATIFAVALLASGLASACAGVYAGQAIMRGFLKRDSSIWLRRMISAVPALIVLGLVHDPTQALVVSQVVLSFGLPFALVPLVVFTSRRGVMGAFTNRIHTTAAGVAISLVIVGLNSFLLVRTFSA